MLKIVLLSTDHCERSTAEIIECRPSITTLEKLIKAVNEEEKRDVFKNKNTDDVMQVYPIGDFTVACNDGIIDTDSWWITYVKLND
jgi:hypothetical protein